jgi:hypothetical protein
MQRRKPRDEQARTLSMSAQRTVENLGAKKIIGNP